MTVAQALAWAMGAGVARLDAQLLLLQALGRPQGDRAWLITHDADALEPTTHAAFEAACGRRLAGEPLAYLVGQKEFFGLPLQVDHRVLVPRPDTETIVEWALEALAGRQAPPVIDLGTGSGAIALAIQSRRPDAHVTAVDRSADALAVAAANAQRLQLPVRFVQADWLQGAGRYDLVVSNPPYVAQGDPHLPALAHEPVSALVAGTDGLSDLRRIAADAPGHLQPGGWLLLEHGWDQAAAVRQLLADAGFTDIGSRRDLAGVERCSGGRWLERG
ncbi:MULTISPECIES: peptide chain release factor N(5)-glutamine methyltransferase [Ramlibacter]|uniref:Release factor glutamine methyltransferase n=1 Tax=Ramlibacter pinisoli TaxID=2682844 RepID=A0A6N8J2B9_9BURK|nr:MULTISPECIES: peptide chain release factor N(5)-glutamine methyltransferase [Ramlibacter]MBA2962404.1 peptide chain release factor N(5)-glutamine methyltransferase [Ramlibacter sp. CGMCC 1.13660]MVQ32346.1 peptide chain release factor N(5)-glutamine methyltransferase [Ramlibacter pinisoli]